MEKDPGLKFEPVGIGEALSKGGLVVPINQRSYAWLEGNVLDLFEDLKVAMDEGESGYFLGTVVLTRGEGGVREVADGQQRLATATILLAAIRDFLHAHGEAARAQKVTSRYLRDFDLRTEDTAPHLALNLDDRRFFEEQILALPEERPPIPKDAVLRISQRRLLAARGVAEEFVRGEVANLTRDAARKLVDWVEYVEKDAFVVLVTVSDRMNAFTIFETLNDRGLQIAQTDTLKNVLYGKAGKHLSEVQPKWTATAAAVEAVGDEKTLLEYVRHYWIAEHGPTRAKDLTRGIKAEIKSPRKARDLIVGLSENAHKYVALLSPEHPHWNDFDPAARRHATTIATEIGVEQIRPLLFAVLRYLDRREAKLAFRLLQSWSVRFLITGGRGGLLDRNYGEAAHKVGRGEIRDAAGLRDDLGRIVPNDARFETAFAYYATRKGPLAKYLLRTLEAAAAGESDPELVPNREEDMVNLEHVLPHNHEAWDVEPERAAALVERLGNKALMQTKANGAAGSAAFEAKRPFLAKSRFALTREIAEETAWDEAQIDARQKRLAALAVRAWPVDPLRKR